MRAYTPVTCHFVTLSLDLVTLSLLKSVCEQGK
jgi:hypothetical protein